MPFFSKCTYLREWNFFLASCLSNQLTFSVVALIRVIFLMEHSFSLLATINMITEKVPFLFPWEALLGNQIHSSQSTSLLTKTTITLKNWSQEGRDYLNFFWKGVSSTPLLRTQAITMGPTSLWVINAAVINIGLVKLPPQQWP